MVSKKCKYAIKAILYIARNEADDRSIFASEIAKNENIPQKFLESILRELCNQRILVSKRGRYGGYRLLKQPSEISFTEVMRIMDGPIALMPCVSLNYYTPCEECNQEEDCVIRAVFLKVRDVTLDIFNAATIDKLA
ncbi:RrF2 family transcriptional regulator [Lewinella cohaerens]|uniref:RrF2 family transcriptional regulator n=1 Tax=Lewinella cohaerens TaxID=70995 RepID=UPI00035C1059|nr:Rrf2 family transcriptional regulator [Lewinella cohaerens]